MMFFSDDLGSLTCEEMLIELKSLIKERMRAMAQEEGLNRLIKEIQEQYARRILSRKGIHFDETCLVHFSDDNCRLKYLGTKHGDICVRYFTTKGKPYKSIHRISHTMAVHFEKITRKGKGGTP